MSFLLKFILLLVTMFEFFGVYLKHTMFENVQVL